MKKRLAGVAVLLAASAGVSLQAQSTEGMVPFAMDHRRASEVHSPADVSFLLDAPTGGHGFIGVRDGHLATADGKRVRLWGVNVTDWSPGSRQIPAKEDASYWAATLARFGVNCVRFQFLDLKEPRGLVDANQAGTRKLDPEQLDREDFFIAELEKRGIYIDLNLLVGRPFDAADGVEDADKLREGAKGTSIFDRRMIELEKEYAQQLLGHRNPYTGRAYTDDPAVALVEINNENALQIGYRAPSAFYRNELTAMYGQWLGAHRSAEQVEQLRKLTGVKAGEAIPLMTAPHEDASAPPMRFYAEAEFYDDVQRGYFEDMQQYIKRTLGSKSLVIGTADHSHAGSGYPILLATSSMDVVDGHDYWQHPEMYVRKAPMVNDPFDSTVVELSRSAMTGRPYTVSEVNNPFPNDYAGEGIPILAAYGELQDWDAILWYTFEPKADPGWKGYVGDAFDILMDPVKMPELAEGALMFLRGDVAKARTTVERSYTKKQVFDSMLLPQASERPYYTPGFPLALPLEHEVRISSLDGPPTGPFTSAASADPILSDTKELAWYTSAEKTGLVTIDTPRTEGLIGFVKANRRSVSHLSAQVENAFCTLLLSSLDGKPIGESSHLLLIAGGRVENTGQAWNTAGTATTEWGGTPTLIDDVKGTVTLRGLTGARGVAARALDGAGQPGTEAVRASRTGEDWTLPLGRTATTWYEIVVER